MSRKIQKQSTSVQSTRGTVAKTQIGQDEKQVRHTAIYWALPAILEGGMPTPLVLR